MKMKILPLTLALSPWGRGESEGKFEVQIRNEAAKFRIPLRSLKRTVIKILKALGYKDVGAHGRAPLLSILLTSDRKIRSLNRRWLRHDRPTDVLAFPPTPPLSPLGGEGRVRGHMPYLGDIVISLDTTRRQAETYGNSFEYELAFYLCHGILHLMGHRDKTKRDAQKMDRMQKQILEQIGVKNSKSEARNSKQISNPNDSKLKGSFGNFKN